MDVVANLRILIRGLGQCMVSQTLRMHISRFLRPVSASVCWNGSIEPFVACELMLLNSWNMRIYG